MLHIHSTFFILSLSLAALLLASCGESGDTGTSDTTAPVIFKLPDSISNKLPATGTLLATISVNGGTAVPMTISADNTTATASISNIPTGNATIVITFTYDENFAEPLVIASLEQTINVTTGNNTVSIQASDYITDIHDEDGDGISNLDELDETSTTSPIVSTCVLGTAILGNCEL